MSQADTSPHKPLSQVSTATRQAQLFIASPVLKNMRLSGLNPKATPFDQRHGRPVPPSSTHLNPDANVFQPSLGINTHVSPRSVSSSPMQGWKSPARNVSPMATAAPFFVYEAQQPLSPATDMLGVRNNHHAQLSPSSGSMLMPASPGIWNANISPVLSEHRLSGHSPIAPDASLHGGGWGSTSIMGGRNESQRRNRGPPIINQPIKTNGHNSKPSVSLNPAAFASVLAHQQEKRKIMVRLPTEVSTLSNCHDVSTIMEEADEDDQSKGDVVSKIRCHWPERVPLRNTDSCDYGDQLPLVSLSVESILSHKALLELNSSDLGSSKFIEIYLPGQNAWSDVRAFVEQERLQSSEKESPMKQFASHHDDGWGVGAGSGDGGTFGLTNSHHDLSGVVHQDNATHLVTHQKGNFAHALSTPQKVLHSQSMSLSIPQSGQPFGPATLTALGLPSPSDKQQPEPHLSTKHSPVDNPSNSTSFSWRDIGRGFGYDISEAEEQTGDRQSSGHTSPAYSLSEDNDSSDLDEADQKPSWLEQRRKVSSMALPQATIGTTPSTNGHLTNTGNPSSEHGDVHTPEMQAQDGRPRSSTGETFASSTLNGCDQVSRPAEDELEGIDVESRGPLDESERIGRQKGREARRFLSQSKDSSIRPDAPAFVPSSLATSDHFRLPSITNSSFGGSLRDDRSNLGLNAAAPSFVPGAFTFTVPTNGLRLPLDIDPVDSRPSQGREKRIRQHSTREVEDETSPMSHSPPRPHPSAASLESALRTDSNAMTPPPFNMDMNASRSSSSVRTSEPQPTLGTFKFQPTATPFSPTAVRHIQRPKIPDFDAADYEPNLDHTLGSRDMAPYPEDSPLAQSLVPSRQNSQQQYSNSSSIPMQSQGSTPRHVHQRDASFITNSSDQSLYRRQPPLASVNRDQYRMDDELVSEDSALTDIIEELGVRVDKALEGWAGKILDEVTIMGQVRPVNMVTLDAVERKALVDAIGREIGDLLADHHDRLQEGLEGLPMFMSSSLQGSKNEDTSSSLSDSDDDKVGRSTKQPVSQEQYKGEDGLHALHIAIENKMSDLQHDLTTGYKAAMSEMMTALGNDQLSKVQAFLEAAQHTVLDKHTRALQSSPVELSTEGSEIFATLLLGRLQPLFDEVAEKLAQRQQKGTADTIETLIEDHLVRTRAITQAEHQDTLHVVKNTLESRTDLWEQTLAEIKDATGDQLQVNILKSILPHIETLRSDHSFDPDVLVGRLTEILLPKLSHAQNNQNQNQTDPQEIATIIANQIRPYLQNSRDPDDSLFDADKMLWQDTLTDKIVHVIEKSMLGQHLDTAPLVAILEPLVEKQDGTRGLVHRILEKQGDMEMTVNILPSAVSSKMEVFLATSQSIQNGHETILTKLDELSETRFSEHGVTDESTSRRIAHLEKQNDHLSQQLDASRREAMDARCEANEIKAELSASSGYSNTLREEVTRLETILEQAQKDVTADKAKASTLHEAEQRAVEQRHAAERQLDECRHHVKHLENILRENDDKMSLLQAHVEQLNAETVAGRNDRTQERETHLQSAKEMIKRTEGLEDTLRNERQRADTLLHQLHETEKNAAQEKHQMMERTARAEGEVSALEKRVAEQDAKIANLQQLTSTQKLKAAQSGQKLSEIEKKLRDADSDGRELIALKARLSELESKSADHEEVARRLRTAQDSETHLRQELHAHQSRFLDVERDLMSMRESLVGREELDQAQADLSKAREEIAGLRGKLAERERYIQETVQHSSPIRAKPGVTSIPEHPSPSHGSTTWASLRAQNSFHDGFDSHNRSSFYVDDSFESARAPTNRGMEDRSSMLSTSRAVAQSEDGWWS